ncbi:hypothetical protein [Limnohabitans sp.]|uniref:hypothetical protein n=1 Tax=Limnohabitans sp. TaxID=1907725 RepID=UPI00286EEF57|nr:hypothetical protein [Limnohabitans sp.]
MKKKRNGKYKVSDRTIWYKDGVPHREDGPAIESSYSSEWYFNGKLHREDGPAIEFPFDKSKRWFIHGVEMTEVELNYWLEKKYLNEKLNIALDPRSKEKTKKI